MKSSNIGGQALLEGIMMRNGSNLAVAVRKPNGEIEVIEEEYKTAIKCKPLTKIPFVRGVFNFIDSLIMGMKTLNYSASFYEEETDVELSEQEAAKQKKKEDAIMAVTMVISVLIAVGLFILLPGLVADLLEKVIPYRIVRTIIESVLRIAIFVGYISIVSFMKDIKRTFMYHGAEHKCINCIEHGLELTVENVRKSSKQHKRCGTSFLFFVMFVSIIVSFFIMTDIFWLRILLRIALLPVVAGISYEIIKLAGKSDNFIMNLLSKPGMALQHLTTKEPDDDMIEVAICAVEKVFDWRTFLEENFEGQQDDAS